MIPRNEDDSTLAALGNPCAVNTRVRRHGTVLQVATHLVSESAALVLFHSSLGHKFNSN